MRKIGDDIWREEEEIGEGEGVGLLVRLRRKKTLFSLGRTIPASSNKSLS